MFVHCERQFRIQRVLRIGATLWHHDSRFCRDDIVSSELRPTNQRRVSAVTRPRDLAGRIGTTSGETRLDGWARERRQDVNRTPKVRLFCAIYKRLDSIMLIHRFVMWYLLEVIIVNTSRCCQEHWGIGVSVNIKTGICEGRAR